MVFIEQFGGIYNFGMAGMWILELIDNTLTWINGEQVIELIPLSDGTFDSIVGRYSFQAMRDEVTSTFTMPAGELSAVRIDNIEDIVAPEGFEQWIGVYNFTPQMPGEVMDTLSQLIISINELGMAMIGIVRVSPHGTQESPLTYIDGRWFLDLMPINFEIDEEGVASIDIIGGQFIRE
jgi:hypothetical protein